MVITFSENGRQFLRQRISTGVIEPYLNAENEDNNIQLDFEDIHNLTNTRSLFYEMSQNIAEQCLIEVTDQVGDHDNMYFIPAVAPLVLNLCTYMSLWSGIMCKGFKYGDITATSASIESQFNDLKNRFLRHVNIPMRIDDFLKLHIQSINGA